MSDDHNNDMRKVILVTKRPTGRLRAKNVWDVYRNRYPEESQGFLKSILGIGNQYNKVATFESRDRAIEYGLEIAEPDEEVKAENERNGAQVTVRAEG